MKDDNKLMSLNYSDFRPMGLMKVNKKSDNNLVDMLNFGNPPKSSTEEQSSLKESQQDRIMERQISASTSPSVSNHDQNLSVQNGVCNSRAVDIIFKLWKRTSHVTSNGMAVGRLELLYDSITACISIHKYDFEELVEVSCK